MDLARLGFDVDTGGLRKGQKELKGLSGQSQKTEKSVGNLGRTIRNLAGALAVGAAFRTVIRNTIEQERVTAQLNQTLKSTGRFTEDLSQGLQDYASELQNVTTYGDEAIISAQAMLLTFTQIGEEAFPRAQEAVLDLATAMGTDLKSATVQVGKALNDPVLGLTALQRSGIQFSETQKEMIKDMVEVGDVAGAQAAILDELETQFGGSARAARDTLGGALQSLQNAFGDLLEGDSGGQGVTGTTRAINELTDTLSSPEMQQAFGTLVESVLKVSGVVAESIKLFVEFGETIGQTIGELVMPPLDVEIKQAREEMALLIDEYNRPRLMRRNPFISTEDLGREVEDARDKLDDLIARRDELAGMGGSQPSGGNNEGVNIGIPMSSVPRGGTSNEDDPAGVGSEDDIRQQMEKRRDSIMQALETEKTAILRVYGERQQEIRELEDAGIEQGGITQTQAAMLRVQNEQEKQDQLNEIVEAAAQERTRIEEREAQRAERLNQLRVQQQRETLGAIGDIFGNMAEIAEKGGKDQFNTWKAMASAQAAVSTALAVTNALAVPPAPVGIALASTIGALGAVQIAQIQSSEYQGRSFDGGGYTGNGSRSGGMDGKGGFLAMMHPRETVVDHTKGGSDNSNSTNVTQVFQLSDNARREAKQAVLESAPFIRQQAKAAVLEAIGQGGSMSRAVGRRS